jgi:hypothetical protein
MSSPWRAFLIFIKCSAISERSVGIRFCFLLATLQSLLQSWTWQQLRVALLTLSQLQSHCKTHQSHSQRNYNQKKTW